MRELHCNLQILKEYELNVNLKVALSYLLAESEIEHQPCAGQTEREGEPDAGQSPIEHEAEEIACRKGDDEIGDEGDVHHRFHIGNAAEGIGIVALHAVAELIDDERDDEAGHHECYFIIVCKPTTYFIPQQEEGNGYTDGHGQDDVKACTGSMTNSFCVLLPVEIADTYRYGSSHAIIHHISQLTDGHHHLMGCQGNGS